MSLRFLLTALLLVMPAATHQSAGFDTNDPQLPDCTVVLNTASDREEPPDLVLLSTLDGKVTAVDSLGGIIWQFETGPALVSSSPKALFLENSRGEMATCIPALDGSLYVFDGKHVQLFVTAERLLRDTLKTGQSFLTGGTEIKTFGLDPRTGQVRYICSADGGCLNLTESDGKVAAPEAADDVVVIRRHTQTVRAIEPRSGKERWHFTVAENELQYLPETSSCGRKPLHEFHPPKESDTVRVLASKGIVTSSKRDSNEVNWEIQLGIPVVGAWKLENSRLLEIDLFEPKNIIGMDENGPKPFLHLGIYQQQLYMHQNRKLSPQDPAAIDTYVRYMLEHNEPETPQNALAPVTDGPSTELIPQMLQTLRNNEDYDTGIYFVQDDTDDVCSPQFFLPPPESNEHIAEIDSTPTRNVSRIDPESRLEEHIADDHTVYLIWHYWRAVFLSSVALQIALSAFLPLLVSLHRYFKPQPAILPAPSTPQPSEGTASSTVMGSSKTVTDGTDELTMHRMDSTSSESRSQENHYVSRFTTDFEPVRCLGKGGFGIVFESRNRIDDCSYAIKRIRLPSKQAAREKVLREVKALAKLDHPHIVRYYNAWLETPPAGWQEAIDETWKSSLPLSSTNALSNEIGTVATAATESSAKTVDPFRPLSVNPLKPFDDIFNELTANGSTSVVNENDSESGSWCNGDEESRDDSEDCEEEECPVQNDREDSIVFQSSSGDHSIVFDSNEKPPKEASSKKSPKKKDSKSEANDCRVIAVRKRPSCLQLEETPSTQPVYLYIQMQLCRKESLKEWLSHRDTLDLRGREKILDIFFQISAAVEYVHEKGLIHRDLKPSNIFFATADDVVKVGDFGLVTGTDNGPTSDYTPGGHHERDVSFDGNFNDVQLTDKVGTQLYMSPEQISGHKYNQKVDIFSLGLIFFELLWLFPTQMDRVDTLTSLKKLQFPKGFKKAFPSEYQLVRQMVAADPTTRPSALEVRRNPLFDDFRQEFPPVGRRRTKSARTSLGSHDSSPPLTQH